MKRHVIQLVFLVFFGFTSVTSFVSAAYAGQIPATDVNDRNADFSRSATMTEPIQAAEIANSYRATRSAGVTISRAVLSGSYITIGGRNISIYNTNSTADDAGTRVARYSNSFLYGHNTDAVFGHLASLPVGTTFSVTIDGQTTNYRITEAVIYHHDYNQSGQELLYPDGLPNRNFMNSILNARANTVAGARQHNLAIMTCHGQSWGGGDAAERLVVFADRI